MTRQNREIRAMNGEHSVESLNLGDHPPDVGIVPIHRARLEYVIASPRISPFQDLDRHSAHSPVVHL